MEKKQSAPIWGLFYREIHPSLKEILLCYVVGIALAFICWLLKLSMEIGNLANLPTETLAMLKATVPHYAIYLPSILFMAVMNGATSNYQFEMTQKFRCFTASIPVSEWKFVGVKFLTSAAILVVGMILSTLNASIMCGVFDTTFDKTIVANLLLSAFALSVMCAVLYTFNYLFRNPTAAVITALLLAYLVMGFAIIPQIDEMSEGLDDMEANAFNSIMEKLTNFSTDFMPFAIPCTIGVLVLGWVLCSLLAKRREK